MQKVRSNIGEDEGDSVLGSFDITVGVPLSWTLGPLTLVISRKAGEIRISTRHEREASLTECTHKKLDENADLATFSASRFSLSDDTHDRFRIQAMSAPRSLVVRLREPVTLLPNTSTSVFVSTPLWIGIFQGDQTEPICEFPTLPLRETWFGPNNRDGEICLSCINKGTIHQTYVDYHPVRAMTRLTVSHRGKSPFTLEKLKLPMRYLSLSRDVNGQFHTDGLKVTTHDDRLSLKLAKDILMDGTKELTLIHGARSRMPSSWERTLNLMLG